MQKFNLIARVLSSDTHVHKRKSVLMSRLLTTMAVLWCGLSSLSAVAQGADTLRLSGTYQSGVSVMADTTLGVARKMILPASIGVSNTNTTADVAVVLRYRSTTNGAWTAIRYVASTPAVGGGRVAQPQSWPNPLQAGDTITAIALELVADVVLPTPVGTRFGVVLSVLNPNDIVYIHPRISNNNNDQAVSVQPNYILGNNSCSYIIRRFVGENNTNTFNIDIPTYALQYPEDEDYPYTSIDYEDGQFYRSTIADVAINNFTDNSLPNARFAVAYLSAYNQMEVRLYAFSDNSNAVLRSYTFNSSIIPIDEMITDVKIDINDNIAVIRYGDFSSFHVLRLDLTAASSTPSIWNIPLDMPIWDDVAIPHRFNIFPDAGDIAINASGQWVFSYMEKNTAAEKLLKISAVGASSALINTIVNINSTDASIDMVLGKHGIDISDNGDILVIHGRNDNYLDLPMDRLQLFRYNASNTSLVQIAERNEGITIASSEYGRSGLDISINNNTAYVIAYHESTEREDFYFQFNVSGNVLETDMLSSNYTVFDTSIEPNRVYTTANCSINACGRPVAVFEKTTTQITSFSAPNAAHFVFKNLNFFTITSTCSTGGFIQLTASRAEPVETYFINDFTAENILDFYDFEWRNANGQAVGNTNPTHVVYDGTYQLFYKLKNTPAACWATDDNLTRDFNTGTATIEEVCEGRNPMLKATLVADGYGYPQFPFTFQWYLNGVSPSNAIAGATGLTYSPTQSGVYTFVAVNWLGCPTASESFTFNFASLSNLTINGNNSYCKNSLTNISADEVAGNTYTWSLVEGGATATIVNPNSATNPKISFTSVGIATIKLRVTTPLGCVRNIERAFTINSVTGTLIVSNVTTGQVYGETDDIIVCPKDKLIFTGSSPDDNVTWYWSSVAGSNIQIDGLNTSTAVVSFSNTSTMTPTIIGGLTSDRGCSTTVFRNITVLGQCCVNDAVFLGKLNETTTYTNTLPPSPSGKYLVVGNIELRTNPINGTFLIENKDIYVQGKYTYNTLNGSPDYGGTVTGSKITVENTKLNIKGSAIQAACDAMWDGLYIGKNASLVLEPIVTTVIGPEPTLPDGVESTPPAGSTTTIKRSLFADSRNGIVELESAGASIISYTDFRNNFISWQATTNGGQASFCTFSSTPDGMKKPFDNQYNSGINPNVKGYYYAHSFIRVSENGRVSIASTNFNGALYAMEFLNARPSPSLADTDVSFISGTSFNNFFVAGIYAANNDLTTAAHTLRLNATQFNFAPVLGNTAQILAEKIAKNMLSDAMYGIYALRAGVYTPNGGNTFTSANNIPAVIGTLNGLNRWGHKFNHIGVYGENSTGMRLITNPGGSNKNDYINLKTGIQLEGTDGNNYLITKSLFTNCETSIYINREASTLLNFLFNCNEFVKTWNTAGNPNSDPRDPFINHTVPKYDFRGVLLKGNSSIFSNGTDVNQIGGCTFNETATNPPARTTAQSPQGNEVRVSATSTNVPQNFIFIDNKRVKEDGTSLPLRYIRFGNENVELLPTPSIGVIIRTCPSVMGNNDIMATQGTCVGTNGVLSRQKMDNDMPQVINQKATLYQNAPNPFGYNTTIGYAVPATTEMTNTDLQLVVIEPVSGKILRQIALKDLAGTIELSTEGLASGMYVYALTSNGSVLATKKMVVTR